MAVLRIATPLILGTLGVLLCERAGVLNLGIEGIMVAGAFAGWYAVYAGAGLVGGVLVAALAGAAFGLLHAALTVGLALSQHVSGLGITLLATALSYYGYRVSFPKVNTPPTITPFGEMTWLPVPVLAQQTPLTLFALLLVPLLGWFLMRTPAGLAVRMVGENPQAAEGQGVSVAAVRTAAIVAGSALMGIAGSFLTLAAFNAFFFNMVNGRGWGVRGAGGVCLLAARQGAAGRAAVRGVRCAATAPAAGRRRGAAVPGVLDAALPAVDRGAGDRGAQGGVPAGVDEALPQGRTVNWLGGAAADRPADAGP